MTRFQAFARQFQFQYRRTNPLTKAAVAAAIALCTVTLVALRMTQWESQAQLGVLQQQAAVLERQNQELKDRIADLGSSDSMRQIAAEQLGLVDPDTIIFEESE